MSNSTVERWRVRVPGAPELEADFFTLHEAKDWFASRGLPRARLYFKALDGGLELFCVLRASNPLRPAQAPRGSRCGLARPQKPGDGVAVNRNGRAE